MTPLMQQYFEIKNNFQDALLFFQVGDFYELFFDDAVQAAAFLNITLTKRGTHNQQPIPLCGVPTQVLDVYLTKLVKGGFRVAICEQLEPATPGKVVKRGVTRVLTPGTLVDTNLLDDKSASYFCSFFPLAQDWGILFGELLATQLFATVLPAQSFKSLESELARFFPDEILLPNNKTGKQLQPFFKSLGYVTTFQAEQQVDQSEDLKLWEQNFSGTARQKLQNMPAVWGALSGFYAYLAKCQQKSVGQFNSISFYEPDNFLILDASTQHHLELVRNNYDGGRQHSLLDVIDQSVTAMGARMLKKWLMRPLVDLPAILNRQKVVAILVNALVAREKIAVLLRQIADLERVVGRIALGRSVLDDYLKLKIGLAVIPELKQTIQALDQLNSADLLKIIDQSLGDFTDLFNLLDRALNTDSSQDWLVKSGFDAQLDQIRALVQDASIKFIELERREQQATGINSLKVRFNSVSGYYIEITSANLGQVPASYLRKQTLVGKERFVTLELQQLELNLEQARQNIEACEHQIFEKIKQAVFEQLNLLRKLAAGLAQLDALLGLANSAYAYGYVPPEFNTQQDIKIVQGRHPVVEQVLESGFIPNDTNLDSQARLWIITGPNMGGKSTYLRQVAVICVLGQIGSFVPAQSANLPILDRIFTRIGASDNLARGKSTFLVEMEETALICQQATGKSLVILDEVGRGTSTFDGLAIAQAVVEYIYTQIGAKCLFATHYHELTNLSQHFAGIANYYAASQVSNDQVLLLHKIRPGVANGSFGVQAAKCADLPSPIIERAKVLLQELSAKSAGMILPNQSQSSPSANQIAKLQEQLSASHELVSQIMQLDLDHMSPRAAFDFLYNFKQRQL